MLQASSSGGAAQQHHHGDTEQLRVAIQPLLAWLHQHAQRLKAAGRWPLQQEDIPANLQHQWRLYQRSKSELQRGGSGKQRVGEADPICALQKPAGCWQPRRAELRK